MELSEQDKRNVYKLASMISRAEQVCLAKDCLTCEYAKYVEKCFPVWVAMSLRHSGVKLKEEIKAGGGQEQTTNFAIECKTKQS